LLLLLLCCCRVARYRALDKLRQHLLGLHGATPSSS
jgi:hypothetical protein